MASNLGSLILQLSANTAQLQSDLGKAYKLAEDTADRMKRAFAGIAGAVGVGLSADAFKDFIASSIDAQDAAVKFSQKVGVAIDSIAGLQSAAAKAGVDSGAFATAMGKLAQSSAAAANGAKQQAAEFAAMGISVKDASGQLKGSDVLLGEIANKFAGYKDGAAKTTLAIALLGKAGAAMIPLLNGGNAAIKEQIDLTKQLGAAYSSDAAKAAEAFNDKISDIKVAVSGVGNQIASALLPALNKLADAALKFFTSDTWKSWLDKISGAFTAIANNIDKIIGALKLAGEIAVDYIGIRMVGATISATEKMIALAGATLAANSAAADMGISWNRGLSDSIKSIGLLNAALGTVTAAIAGWQIGTYLRENFAVARVAGDAFVGALLEGWEKIKLGAQVLWLEFAKQFAIMKDGVLNGVGDMAAALAKVTPGPLGAKLNAVAAEYHNAAGGAAAYDAQIAAVEATSKKNIDTIRATITDMVTYDSAQEKAAAATEAHGNAAQKAAPNVANLGAAQDLGAKYAQKYADALAKLAKSSFDAASAGDPLQKIYSDYAKQIAANQKAFDDGNRAIDAGNLGMEKRAKLIAALTDANKAQLDALDKTLYAYQQQNDLILKSSQALERQAQLMGVAPQYLNATRAALDAYDNALAKMTDLHGKVYTSLDELKAALAGQIPEYQANIQASQDLQEQYKLNQEAAKQWAGIWTNSANSVADAIANFATGGIKKFSDFGKALMDIARQTVQQIIAYFLKLEIINPILTSLFGATAGSLPMAANAAGNGGVLGSLFGGGDTAAGGTSGQSLFSPTTWISAGKSIWSGFSSGYESFMGGFNGTYTNTMTVPSGGVVNLPYGATPGGLGYGGYGSPLGQGLGIAGSIYAGIGEYKNAGGGAAGVAGGLAYGAGTYFGGTIAAGALAGGAAGAGAAVAAIPVVGWVALAAMVINMISGGKLFGTSYQTKSSDVNLAVGPDGGTATASLYQEGQKALFGGIKRRTQSIAAPDDAVKAAQDLFDAIQQTMESAAKATETAVVPVIQASIDTITEYDKKGHAKSTKYLVKAFGQQWEEATAELAQKRLVADAILTQVAASKAGADAIKIAQQWQSSADLLADGTQMLLGAAADMAHGIGLLGNDGSLADVAALTQKLAQSGETLTDAYARLETETQTVTKFLDAMHVGLGKTGADLVTFIDDMTSAAGGLQNLQSLWANYYGEFYSSAEQAANNLDSLQKASATALGAISEDAGVSMEQFRSDFEKALPTLSADQVIQWLQAGDALAKFTVAMNQTTAAANQAADQAAAAYIQNFQQLVQTTQDLVDQIFGTPIDRLKAKADDLKAQIDATKIQGADTIGNLIAKYNLSNLQSQYADVQKQIADAQAAQDAAAKLSQSTQLIGNLGQVGALTGADLSTLAGQFKIPLDQFAKYLGTDSAGLSAQYKNAVDQARATMTVAENTDYANKLLADILAQMANKPLPYSDADLNAARGVATPMAAAPSTKPVPRGASGGPVVTDTATAVEDGTKPIVDATKSQTKDVVSVMKEMLAELRAMHNERGAVGFPRNTRPMTPYAVITP